jgi:hypothetical protein
MRGVTHNPSRAMAVGWAGTETMGLRSEAREFRLGQMRRLDDGIRALVRPKKETGCIRFQSWTMYVLVVLSHDQ